MYVKNKYCQNIALYVHQCAIFTHKPKHSHDKEFSLYVSTFRVISNTVKARGWSSAIQAIWRLVPTYMHTFTGCTDHKTTMTQSMSNQELDLQSFFKLFYNFGIQATGLNLLVNFSCGTCSSFVVYEGLGSHGNTG